MKTQDQLCAPELERQVVAAVFVNNDCYADIMDYLNEEDYSDPNFQSVFRIMGQLYRDPNISHIDVLTVLEAWRKEAGGDADARMAILLEIQNAAIHSEYALQYAKMLRDLSVKRQLITQADLIIKNVSSGEGEAVELLQEAESAILGIRDKQVTSRVTPVNDALTCAYQEFERASNGEAPSKGVYSGYPALDNLTHGFFPEDLIILAARPGVGKTALMVNIAMNIMQCRDKAQPVLIYSMEMSPEKIAGRMLYAEAQVDKGIVHTPERITVAEKQAVKEAYDKLYDSPCIIDDTPALDIYEFYARTKRAVKKHNIGIIMVDYLQLMRNTSLKGQSRQEQIAGISSMLKQIAMELKVPVIALSQLNRNIENREADARKPQLSDLRDSGAIEQDADMVIFIHRVGAIGTQVADTVHTM